MTDSLSRQWLQPQRRRWPAFLYVAASRLVLLGLLMLTVTVTQQQSDPAFYIFLCFALVCSIPLSWRYRNLQTRQAFSYQYFIVDVLVVTGLVHFTGGIRSQLLLLYPLVILAAGIVGSASSAFKTALLSMILYATLLFLEMEKLLIYRGPPPFPYQTGAVVMQELMLCMLLFAFFAAAAVFLCSKHNSEKTLNSGLQVTQFIFDHVGAALLALDEHGHLLLGNAAAAKLLGIRKDKLAGLNFLDFFVADKPDLANPDGVKMWELQQSDGNIVKAAFQISAVQLPVNDADHGEMMDSKNKGFIAALWNMSEVDNVQESDSTRLQVAKDVASEVAHYVRNPLTAIKLADEMVMTLVGNGKLGGNSLQFSNSELSLIASMCQVISDETQELESRVDNFLNCKDATEHASLRKLLDEADAAKIQLSRDLE